MLKSNPKGDFHPVVFSSAYWARGLLYQGPGEAGN